MVQPGDVLAGRYRFDARLGRGGMGEVWAAHDELLDRSVAVKILLAAMETDPELTARLRQEARTAGALRHPAITVVHDVGDHDGHPYFVMELLIGRTFAALQAELAGGLPVELALRLMAQVADALAYAHDRGVVHRDINPRNLMSLPGGVKICDFGLALFAEASARLTQHGAVIGTPPFMAPEQWRGEPIDARTDLYAFGATLHTLLTGTEPFPGPTHPAYAHQHISIPPPSVSSLRTGIPRELDDLIQRLLAKDPADRPATAGQVQTILQGIGDGLAIPVRPRDAPPPDRATTPGRSTGAMIRSEIIGTQWVFWLMAFAGAFGMGVKSSLHGFSSTWFADVLSGFLALGAAGAVVTAILVALSVHLDKRKNSPRT